MGRSGVGWRGCIVVLVTMGEVVACVRVCVCVCVAGS